MSEESKETLNKLLEYFKESDINSFGYEQDKLISYEEAQIILDYITNLQEENEKLKKDLEIEINSSNLKSSRIETKDIIIKKLQSAKDKTINYVNQKLNADDPVLVEFEIETIIDLLEGE